jgi:drug/metabolite transporter (DMT)-like permease
LGAALALLSAASWGTGDFFGGLATRRAHVLVALVATQVLGVLLAGSMVVISGDQMPQAGALAWACLAGISGVIGLAGLYLALARGTMGLVAPLTAVVAATVPAVVGVVRGDPLDPIVALGLLLALAAVALVAMPDRTRAPDVVIESQGRSREWALIAVAGLGFAGFFLGVDQAHSDGAGTWWTLAAARSASLAALTLVAVALLGLGRAPSTKGIRAVLPLVAASAVGDTGGNLFFLLSRSETTLAVSVVLSSLYPVTTAILAWIVLHERLSRLALVGVALAVAGVMLIGLGSTTG